MGVWAWLAAVVAVLVAAVYPLLVWRYAYWRRRGVPAHRPRSFVGSFADAFFMRKTIGEVYGDIYRQFSNQPACGYFKCLKPALMIRDPELVGTVLVKDFSSFKDNDIHLDRDVDPMFSRSPFNEKGDKWKHVRTQLTSTFTPARMRALNSQLVKVSEELAEYLQHDVNREAGLDVKRMAAMFATDAVALCMLGVSANSLRDQQSEFGSIGRFLLDASLWDSVSVMLILLMPKLANFLRIRFVPDEVAEFFRKVMREATEARRSSGGSTDYLQLSMVIREKYPDFTDEDAAAHAAMFYMDGFEPTSTILAMALFHLALDSEVQERAAAEVAEVLEVHQGRLDYDSLQDLRYLDMVVCETLRMYPPLRSLDRLCTRPYNLELRSGHVVSIEPGTPVIIPVHALHYDPIYYPDPERFEPTRFSEEGRASRPKFTFLPFGEGPRICIGQRYAVAVAKLALATVLRDYKLAPRADTPSRVSHDLRSAFYLAPRETLRLRFLSRQPY